MVFNGREFSASIITDLKEKISHLDFVPEFSDILVTNDGPSVRYVKMKAKTANDIGIKFVDATLPVNSSTEDLIQKINELSMRPDMCGIIVQLPLPAHIDTQKVINSIPLNLDVDGLSESYDKAFYETSNIGDVLIMPTASAVLKILNSALNDLSNKNIVVVGNGKLVGKPVIYLLQKLGHSVGLINSKTEDLEKKELLKNADIIISAVGKPGVVTGENLKDNVIVIDAGTLEVSGELRGDVDFNSVSPKASFITPTPGGVGPVTVACLMENILLVALKK